MPAHAWGTLDAGPSRRGSAQAFSSIAACTAVGWPSATGPAIHGAPTRPNVDGVAGRIQEVSYYHRVTPCGPEAVHEGHPVRRRGFRPRRRQRWGRAFRRRGPLVSGERPVLTQVRSMGPVDPFSPRVAPGVSMDAK